jgi:hypothetical protein
MQSWSLHSDLELQDKVLRLFTALHDIDKEYLVVTWNGLGVKPTVYVRDESVESRLLTDAEFRGQLKEFISGLAANHYLSGSVDILRKRSVLNSIPIRAGIIPCFSRTSRRR